MLTVVQQIIAYVTMEVLEPNWRALEAKIASVTTVDQLLRDHVDFLDTCLKESMLTNARILKVSRVWSVSYESGVIAESCSIFRSTRSSSTPA